MMLFVLTLRSCVFHRYDGDSSENSTDNPMDKSKPWSRSIEDLHGGNNHTLAVTGNSRTGRHSTLRFDHLTQHICCYRVVNKSVRNRSVMSSSEFYIDGV